MGLPKKAKRKSKPPSKLKEFFCDDIEIQEGLRRSRRPPKITEKLKCYMDEQAGMAQEEEEVQMKKGSPLTLSSGKYHLLGSEYKEPKVVLKSLPTSVLLRVVKKYPPDEKEVRVTLKRLGNNVITKTSNRTVASRLHKQKINVRKVVTTSSNTSQASPSNRKLKSSLENISVSTKRSPENKRGRYKRVHSEEELQLPTKSRRGNPKASDHQVKNEKAKQKEDPQFDPDVMQKLIDFGSKLDEAMTSNKKEVNKLTKVKKQAQSLSQKVSQGLEDIDEGDIHGILLCLEESEKKWKNHREMMLKSFRESHTTHVVLYSQMLSVLQSVTTSV